MAVFLDPVDLFAALPVIHADKKKIIHPQNILRPVVGGAIQEELLDDVHIKDYLSKIRHPDIPHINDIFLDSRQKALLHSVVLRLQRMRKTAGYGNFCVLGFDEALKIAKDYSSVGTFSDDELDFLEMIFYRDAREYGFYGKKQTEKLTRVIQRRGIDKISNSGNYLFVGDSQIKYEEIKRKLGENAVLTSGIRGVVKQFYLFLAKALRNGGNISLASRSLAPPGYSYHATGDFDIGQKGFGVANFSERFTFTPVFKKLAEQGFVKYRYKRDNMLGVRYEPWHIKV
jgi:hypothetical protein